jgi:curved DNA-binding protein CbpA
MSDLAEHYATLGLEVGVPFDQVKFAYRKLIFKNHTDKQGGNKSKAQEINAAYTAINNAVNPARPDPPPQTSQRAPQAPQPPPHTFQRPPQPPPHTFQQAPQAPPRAPPRAPQPPPRAPQPPPRQSPFDMRGFADEFRSGMNADVHMKQNRICFQGNRCTIYGCKFSHPAGYSAPQFPKNCKFGWQCHGRGITCKFYHIRESREQRGPINVIRTEVQYINEFGVMIDNTSTKTSRAF